MSLKEAANEPLQQRLTECRGNVESALDRLLPREDEPPAVLHRAMRYAVFAGGKRLRPFLVLESCRAVGGNVELAMPAACAVEVLHTHSLVHDDLPCMDNDDLRRGKPTCHKVFGEGMAVLCGDALLSLAFEILAVRLPETGLDAPTALRCTETLTQAAGSRWLAGGQAMDITEQTTNYTDRSPETVLRIHERKTVALMQACCAIGGLIGRTDDGQIRRLREYGYWLGLAFQITDDILDQTGDGKSLGKTVGKDAQQKKLTYPMVFGLERSRCLASEAAQSAVRALDSFDGVAELLCALALSLPERQS